MTGQCNNMLHLLRSADDPPRYDIRFQNSHQSDNEHRMCVHVYSSVLPTITQRHTPNTTTLQLMTTNMAAYPYPLIGDPAVTRKRKSLTNNTKTASFTATICLQNFPFHHPKSAFFPNRLKPERIGRPICLLRDR